MVASAAYRCAAESRAAAIRSGAAPPARILHRVEIGGIEDVRVVAAGGMVRRYAFVGQNVARFWRKPGMAFVDDVLSERPQLFEVHRPEGLSKVRISASQAIGHVTSIFDVRCIVPKGRRRRQRRELHRSPVLL